MGCGASFMSSVDNVAGIQSGARAKHVPAISSTGYSNAVMTSNVGLTFPQLETQAVAGQSSARRTALVSVTKAPISPKRASLINRFEAVSSKRLGNSRSISASDASSEEEQADNSFKSEASSRTAIDLQDEYGETGLIRAAQQGQEDVVRLLIIAGANMNLQNNNGCTALYMAAVYGQETIVDQLILAGADKHLASKTSGFTALHVAAAFGHENITHALIVGGANVHVQNNCGLTALHVATQHGKTGCADLLILSGAEVDFQDHYGRTALHEAAMYGHSQIVGLLLAAGARLDVQDNCGCTALHEAAFFGEGLICKMLKENGADASIEDLKGETALTKAKINANAGAANVLAADKDDALLLAKGCFSTLYVCPKDAFLGLSRLVQHEHAVSMSYVTPYPGNGKILFCSHRWLDGKNHPDSNENIKLTAIQTAVQQHPDFVDVQFIWFDFLCLPQCDAQEQLLSINSLPYIIEQCTHFMVLEGESGVTNSAGEDEASYSVFMSRGWCRLECWLVCAPRVRVPAPCCCNNTWRCSIRTGMVQTLNLSFADQLNPFDGIFNNSQDRATVSSMIYNLCVTAMFPCKHELIRKIKQDAFSFSTDHFKKRFEIDPI